MLPFQCVWHELRLKRKYPSWNSINLLVERYTRKCTYSFSKSNTWPLMSDWTFGKDQLSFDFVDHLWCNIVRLNCVIDNGSGTYWPIFTNWWIATWLVEPCVRIIVCLSLTKNSLGVFPRKDTKYLEKDRWLLESEPFFRLIAGVL